MKGEFLRAYAKIYLELEGLKFPEVLIESAYSNLANFLRDIPVGVRRITTRDAGKKVAESFKNFLRDRYKITEIKEEEVPAVVETFFKISGMGDVKCEVDGDKIRVEVKDSFMLRANPDPNIALGQFMGIIEGFISELLGKEVVGKIEGNSYILTIKSGSALQ
jgi:predicted hydrocarbon binding protein